MLIKSCGERGKSQTKHTKNYNTMFNKKTEKPNTCTPLVNWDILGKHGIVAIEREDFGDKGEATTISFLDSSHVIQPFYISCSRSAHEDLVAGLRAFLFLAGREKRESLTKK